jgi:uncharacterized protein
MVAALASLLVDHPDEVDVTVEDRGRGSVVALRVAAGDMGQVIGRSGRVARALRTLVGASARDGGARVTLDIVD